MVNGDIAVLNHLHPNNSRLHRKNLNPEDSPGREKPEWTVPTHPKHVRDWGQLEQNKRQHVP